MASEVFLQWKNSEVCLDFTCECGTEAHHDGGTNGQVKCPGCDVVWVIEATARHRTNEDYQHQPLLLTADEETP